MNRLFITALAACVLGMTACQPEGQKAREREEPRSSLQFAPDSGPELTGAQVEDFRAFFKKTSSANAASLTLIPPDEGSNHRARREQNLQNASATMKTLLSSIKASCKIQHPTVTETGDSATRGHESVKTTTSSILGERCPVVTTTQHSRTVSNESFNPADLTGRLSMSISGTWSYELKDANSAKELGLLSDKISLSARGPIDYFGNRVQGDIRGGGQGTWQLSAAEKTDYTLRMEMVITGPISNTGSATNLTIDSAFYIHMNYKNVDHRLSLHVISANGKETKEVFLNGKKISGEGFEDFSPEM